MRKDRKRQEKTGKAEMESMNARKKNRHQNSWKQSKRLAVWMQEEGRLQMATKAGSKCGDLTGSGNL